MQADDTRRDSSDPGVALAFKDSRSDLYSLGAMLYDMVTGRPPFLGDDAVAIIGQHINTPPVAPTWHNGQCPRSWMR